jgi:hypothetical protein
MWIDRTYTMQKSLNVIAVIRDIYHAVLSSLKDEAQGLVDAQSSFSTTNIFTLLQGKTHEKSILMVWHMQVHVNFTGQLSTV